MRRYSALLALSLVFVLVLTTSMAFALSPFVSTLSQTFGIDPAKFPGIGDTTLLIYILLPFLLIFVIIYEVISHVKIFSTWANISISIIIAAMLLLTGGVGQLIYIMFAAGGLAIMMIVGGLIFLMASRFARDSVSKLGYTGMFTGDMFFLIAALGVGFIGAMMGYGAVSPAGTSPDFFGVATVKGVLGALAGLGAGMIAGLAWAASELRLGGGLIRIKNSLDMVKKRQILLNDQSERFAKDVEGLEEEKSKLEQIITLATATDREKAGAKERLGAIEDEIIGKERKVKMGRVELDRVNTEVGIRETQLEDALVKMPEVKASSMTYIVGAASGILLGVGMAAVNVAAVVPVLIPGVAAGLIFARYGATSSDYVRKKVEAWSLSRKERKATKGEAKITGG